MPVTIDGTTGVTTPGATVGSITGILKATSGVVAQAVAGTDYLVGGGSAITSTNTAKAWVNFNGTLATPSSVGRSYNVSSITKNATGDYTVNFATAMSDANYSGLISSSDTTLDQPIIAIVSNTTTTFRGRITGRPTGAAGDAAIVSVTIFGN